MKSRPHQSNSRPTNIVADPCHFIKERLPRRRWILSFFFGCVSILGVGSLAWRASVPSAIAGPGAVRSTMTTAHLSKPDVPVAMGYTWAPGVTAYKFSTSLHAKFTGDSGAGEEGVMADVSIAGVYHLRVLDVTADEVRIAAMLTNATVTNAEEPAPDAAALLQKICLLHLRPDGSLKELRFPRGTRGEDVTALRAVFGWQFAIAAGQARWSRDERDEDGGVATADYQVQPEGGISKRRRLPPLPDSGTGTRMQASAFIGVPSREVWLDKLAGSEQQQLINEGEEIAVTRMTVAFDRVHASPPAALMAQLDPANFVVVAETGGNANAERLHQIPLSVMLNLLAQYSADGRSLEHFSGVGHQFQLWLQANPERAAEVVDALRQPMPDGASAFLCRALADTAPLAAARLLDNAARFPADVVYQQLGSLTTSTRLRDMPSSIGSAIACVINDEATADREYDAGILALGAFAGEHPEWLPPLWDALRPNMQADAETAPLATGLYSLANSRKYIP
ncbi:MAG TPA: hypothetical protein VD994_09870, partial [Prosthecobacter sp.]|nr:hypothetical protein [Prosthecobacter sp.]